MSLIIVHKFCIILTGFNYNYGVLQAEERRRLEKENRAMIAEELERVKIETEHEKAEIKVRLGQKKSKCVSQAPFFRKRCGRATFNLIFFYFFAHKIYVPMMFHENF